MTQHDRNLGFCEEANTYCSIAEKEYKQIRAEVIDECIEMLEHDCFVSGTASKVLIHHFEQLKENK